MEITDLRPSRETPGVTLDEDIYEDLPDGRRLLVGRAGQTIPLALAQRHGLALAGPDVRGDATKAEPGTPPTPESGDDAPVVGASPITPAAPSVPRRQRRAADADTEE